MCLSLFKIYFGYLYVMSIYYILDIFSPFICYLITVYFIIVILFLTLKFNNLCEHLFIIKLCDFLLLYLYL